MKRFIYFPAGRKLWFDIADRLDREGVATPALWLGDPRLDRRAHNRFPDCRVLSANSHRAGRVYTNTSYRGDLADFWTGPGFYEAKEKVLKLLDRGEWHLMRRNVTREAYFNGLCAICLTEVARAKPDLLVMSESPHGPSTLLVYEIARHCGIPILSFASFIYAPGMLLKSGGIDGAILELPEECRSPHFADIALSEVPRWVDRLRADDRSGYDPAYLANQKKVEARRAARKHAFERFLPGRRTAHTGSVALRSAGGSVFDRDRATPRELFGVRTLIHERVENLKSALAEEASKEIPERFVYFPLHYEPERTSNPDGGRFHNQTRCLAALRAILPDEVGIVVKEHPSQLMTSTRGFMGRTPAFYSIIKQISGVTVADPDLFTRDLILRSEFVATVTGSAAIEAALLGRRSLIFGSTWFSGCPCVHSISEEPDYATLRADSDRSPSEICEWLIRRAQTCCVPGAVNPSNVRKRKNFYEDMAFVRDEKEYSYRALKWAIRTTIV